MDENRWRDPAWLDGARAWVDDHLAATGTTRTGDAEQTHVTPWSTVLAVPTPDGPVWFKANDDSLRHEAALVEVLSARRPDAVPPLLAADTDRGWMLMRDAGENLRAVIPRERSLARWRDALALYASVQLDLEADAQRLVDLGVPDLRLPGLPAAYAALMDTIDAEPRFREAQAEVERLCAELAAFGIADTVQHDDLHDGQVFVQGDRHLLLDWGDACVTHPFLTLSVTLEGVIAWGVDDEEDSEELGSYRDAYLAPYAERYDGDLASAVPTALRLGWACRAVNGHVPGDDDHTRTRLRMFVDGRA